jgi:hypothetical protein
LPRYQWANPNLKGWSRGVALSRVKLLPEIEPDLVFRAFPIFSNLACRLARLSALVSCWLFAQHHDVLDADSFWLTLFRMCFGNHIFDSHVCSDALIRRLHVHRPLCPVTSEYACVIKLLHCVNTSTTKLLRMREDMRMSPNVRRNRPALSDLTQNLITSFSG